MADMSLTVRPQVVPCNGTRLQRYAPIKGKVPIWHMSYYDCQYCEGEDGTPRDNVAFELADGSTTSFLITGDLLVWWRQGWGMLRGVVLTELVRAVGNCPHGRHQYWRWRFMTDKELALLGPPEEV